MKRPIVVQFDLDGMSGMATSVRVRLDRIPSFVVYWDALSFVYPMSDHAPDSEADQSHTEDEHHREDCCDVNFVAEHELFEPRIRA